MSYFMNIDSKSYETFLIDLKSNEFIHWDNKELAKPHIQERLDMGYVFYNISEVEIHSHFFALPPSETRISIHTLPRFDTTQIRITCIVRSMDEILSSRTACY